MNTTAALFGISLGSVAIWLATAVPASAIPPFARKYHTSCLTCHVTPPKLNAFGRAFKNRGYRMPGDDEELIKEKQVPIGSPSWKRVWPEGTWPSSIPGGNYFGIDVEANFEVNPSAAVTNSFDGIGEVGLLFGGTLGESFSFYSDIELFENGSPGGIGRLFVQYSHPSNYFNVRIGQFEPRAAPFSNHLRLSRFTGYLMNLYPTVPAGNFFGFSPNQKGVEIWGGKEGPGKKGGLMWSAGVVNGNFGGAVEALEDSPLSDLIEELELAADTHGNGLDVNSEKDFYFQASYKIGGLGVFGSGGSDVLVQAKNWRDNSLTLNGYYYRGVTGAFVGDGPTEDFSPNGNTFYRTGVTFDAWIYDLNVFGGWQRNHDSIIDGRIYRNDITMVEANYVTPWPWLQPLVRFERVRPDFAPSFTRTTLSLSMMIRANVVFTVDGVVSGKQAPELRPFDDRFRMGLRVYF